MSVYLYKQRMERKTFSFSSLRPALVLFEDCLFSVSIVLLTQSRHSCVLAYLLFPAHSLIIIVYISLPSRTMRM